MSKCRNVETHCWQVQQDPEVDPLLPIDARQRTHYALRCFGRVQREQSFSQCADECKTKCE